jgi:hypothetical protein
MSPVRPPNLLVCPIADGNNAPSLRDISNDLPDSRRGHMRRGEGAPSVPVDTVLPSGENSGGPGEWGRWVDACG